MDNPLTAQARAVEETAKATGKAIDAARDAGGYLSQVFGDLPTNAVGFFGADWLHERRVRNLDAMKRRTAEILREREVERLIELSPNQATELLLAAQDWSREELAELWARLLANAMDPNLNSVPHSFIEAVKKMDPIDAVVLKSIGIGGFSSVRRGFDQIKHGAVGFHDLCRISGYQYPRPN